MPVKWLVPPIINLNANICSSLSEDIQTLGMSNPKLSVSELFKFSIKSWPKFEEYA
jgi:hypothetical protein